MKSVLVEDTEHCYVCGSPYVQAHHVIYGTANRQISDRYGYIVPLCAEHHTGRVGAHHNKDLNMHLKRMAQRHFEEHEGTREDFIRIFGKNYITEE